MDIELLNKVKAALDKCPNRPTTQQASELFAIHNNDLFPNNKEHGIGCGGCRQRVRERVQTWYNENKPEDEQEEK